MSDFHKKREHLREMEEHFACYYDGTLANNDDFEFQAPGVNKWHPLESIAYVDLVSNILVEGFRVRLKTKSTHRPFNNGSEFSPHIDKWIRRKWHKQVYRVCSFSDTNIQLSDKTISYDSLFEEWEFVNSPYSVTTTVAPCGVKV